MYILKTPITERVLIQQRSQNQMAGSYIQTRNKVRACLVSFGNRDDCPPGQIIKESDKF